jgi:hypothetical protein
MFPGLVLLKTFRLGVVRCAVPGMLLLWNLSGTRGMTTTGTGTARKVSEVRIRSALHSFYAGFGIFDLIQIHTTSEKSTGTYRYR